MRVGTDRHQRGGGGFGVRAGHELGCDIAEHRGGGHDVDRGALSWGRSFFIIDFARFVLCGCFPGDHLGRLGVSRGVVARTSRQRGGEGEGGGGNEN